MLRKAFFIICVVGVVVVGALLYLKTRPQPPLETKFVVPKQEQSQEEATKSGLAVKKPSETIILPSSGQHVYQTFNNCGPATLSMMLGWYGVAKSQGELGELMRPYQHPKGDNDDKTIFPEEFAAYAETFGLSSVHRVNGSIDLLKLFIANDIPVVVKTWLKKDEDIGHFRIVRGFDEHAKVIIQDDSYQGPNKRISYFDFLTMWQPFNYGYIIVYPKEKEELVFAILGQEKDERVAWEHARARAQEETQLDPENVYPWFNLASSSYNIGEYEKSVEAFETVEEKLPRRMLWYQIEPILAYRELGKLDRVFAIIDRIVTNGNRAYSELYQIRGEIYLGQGDKERAKQEFELALLYNKNFEPAKRVLEGF